MPVPTDPIQAEIESAQELVKRIAAMVYAPYWTSERRAKIGETAEKAGEHLKRAIEHAQSLHPNSAG